MTRCRYSIVMPDLLCNNCSDCSSFKSIVVEEVFLHIFHRLTIDAARPETCCALPNAYRVASADVTNDNKTCWPYSADWPCCCRSRLLCRTHDAARYSYSSPRLRRHYAISLHLCCLPVMSGDVVVAAVPAYGWWPAVFCSDVHLFVFYHPVVHFWYDAVIAYCWKLLTCRLFVFRDVLVGDAKLPVLLGIHWLHCAKFVVFCRCRATDFGCSRVTHYGVPMTTTPDDTTYCCR